jgi:adenosine deaminase
MQEICYQVPKAELHVHLEGTMTVELMEDLAKKHGMRVPKEVYTLTSQKEAFDLDAFFSVYYGAQGLLIDSEDFAEALFRYL